MSAELVCLGLATADLIVELPRWPEPDGRLVVGPMRRSGGGPAATAAVAAARLGRQVALVAAVGTDEAGRRVRAGLAAEGVDAGLVLTTAGRTSESVILLDAAAATRTILHAPGAALAEAPPELHAAFGTAEWIHVDQAGWPVAAAAGLSRERLSVDAGNAIDGLDLDGLGLYAPTARSLADRYPRASLGRAVAGALRDGALRVAVTLGAAGAVAADATGAWRIPGVTVDVRSTLGAGDVFHGALLAALLAGHDLAEATRHANLAAALSCRGIDGREAIPTAAELARDLATAPAAEPILLEELS